MMEKTFVLRSSIPEIATNGRIAIFSTLDRRVSHIVIIDPSFDWINRSKQECFRCPNCKAFILPDEKSKTKDGIRYHKECRIIKPKPVEKEIINEREPGDTLATPA